MAGEIQEPLRLNFQADLLQSGSVSFGRFESESLSWEKRSSFSHNRYLEEVEKYSKPGSVTEKKAYFEAHFRRKALLKQSSSENQTIKNDDLRDLQDTEKFDNENIETLCCENRNESNHVTTLDENFDLEIKVAPTELNENIETGNAVNSRSQRKLPSKISPALEMKQPKPNSKAQTSFSRVQRIVPGEAPNASAKTRTTENKGLLMKEKQNISPSSSFATVKIRPSSKSIVKENRSGNTMRMKSPVTEKSVPRSHQTVNRIKHPVITPSKPHVNQNADITQSRKSLNFKATPMPSFYKESSRCADQNKVISTSKTPNRPQTVNKMTPHANRYLSNSTTSSTCRRPSSSTSLTHQNRPAEASRRVQVKKKDSGLHKQKEPQPTERLRARVTSR